MTSTLTEALRWLALGVAPIPVRPGQKEAAVKWAHWQEQLPPVMLVEHWFKADNVNLGLITGGPSGLFVLDFDDQDGYSAWQRAHPVIALTYTVSTARGRHVYLFANTPTASQHMPGGDVKAHSGYVLAPPSVHPSGTRYQALDSSAPVLHVAGLSSVVAVAHTLILGEQAQHALTPGMSVGPAASPAQPQTGDGHYDVAARIKATLPLLTFARPLIALESSDSGGGRWYLGLCPFHDDHHPSLWLDAHRDRWGCFAPQCRAHRSGDVIDLFALTYGVTVQQAIARLAVDALPPMTCDLDGQLDTFLKGGWRLDERP